MADTPTARIRPFSDWITDHARGVVDDQLTLALADVTKAVAHLDKKGKVTLEIQVEPAGSGGRTVSTRCTVTAKAPEADPEVSIFYVDEHGQLVRDDPFQTRFDDLKKVDPDTGEIRTLED